jgi:hypothetical protein
MASGDGCTVSVEIDLLAIDRGIVTAPAGCGKTHLVADALMRHTGSKPILVLTHTNAGVAALRSRLDRKNVPASRYRLYTIDGWAIRLVKTFPRTSAIDPPALLLHDRKRDYPLIREAAWRLLHGRHIDDVLRATYDRIIVDEYQDCSQRQHGIVCNAAIALRTVLLGDPMQAIFGFGDPLPDWNTEVCQHFPVVGQLCTPHRWICVGEEAFGRWLLDVRPVLEAGGSIDLSGPMPTNIRWVPLAGDARDHATRLSAGMCAAPGDEKVLIIADFYRPAAQQRKPNVSMLLLRALICALECLRGLSGSGTKAVGAIKDNCLRGAASWRGCASNPVSSAFEFVFRSIAGSTFYKQWLATWMRNSSSSINRLEYPPSAAY